MLFLIKLSLQWISFGCCCFCRMKKKYYSWDECLNLREVKVSSELNCYSWLDTLHVNQCVQALTHPMAPTLSTVYPVEPTMSLMQTMDPALSTVHSAEPTMSLMQTMDPALSTVHSAEPTMSTLCTLEQAFTVWQMSPWALPSLSTEGADTGLDQRSRWPRGQGEFRAEQFALTVDLIPFIITNACMPLLVFVMELPLSPHLPNGSTS